ncbi:hypothetical protein ACEZCY_02730 [Streptacidiphilus sp. N1-12]|uniref:Uncharacterized protein n=2 Tax=Streptacidiphilus alkalitolerans TaxID=3342712 RepID=A0ABV6W8Q3_9ACTN
MGNDEYWVVVCRGETVLGGGVLLTRHHALTADPYQRGLPAEENSVRLFTANGDRLYGTVIEANPTMGLALVSVAAHPRQDLATPRMDHAVKGDEWQAPYRPSQLVRRLSGTVDAVTHEPGDGSERPHTTIQLTCDRIPDQYTGYRGGPVERRTHGTVPALVGILTSPEAASSAVAPGAPDTLTAGAIDSAMDVFEGLSAYTLAQWLVGVRDDPTTPAEPQQNGTPPVAAASAATRTRRQALDDQLEIGNRGMEILDGWVKLKSIEPLDATPYRLAIADALVEAVTDAISRTGGEL